ncbi:filamentous hemagglutinin N-terminal domain-containing protein, partial [Salmonella enterica subsp. enterica serovar Java]|nr:filamentous hemagglutinin N-terminal domain-containing protein [Salmonella enterica subsp. enterica serovar Java]
MNKIYKLKFDKRRNELVAVSELTAGTGKEKSTGQVAALSGIRTFRQLLGTLTPLAFLTGLAVSLLPGLALAADLPAGGQIVGGQGSISTAGNQMTIHQQTQNMATNWQSFDIGKNHTVQFVQPDSSSVALNRVTGASASRIMGNLNANGKVFLVNPNGVLFGKGASVNTAGLVASTKHISTADFMKGNYTFSGGGVAGAEVVNQGSLTTTKGGFIVLAADRVSNRGTITTPSGKAVLAAADKVTLTLDRGGLTSVVVNGSVANALVENRGLMSATDGQVYLTARGKDMLLNTVVNNSGTLEASGLTANGGVIRLDGGDHGVVTQAGQLLADSHAGQGGKIILEGQNIHLAGNSLTSATGKAGGGEVYVGGGWQGKDSHIKNASKVVMSQGATVDVSAAEAGSGGTAVLWSDDYTNVRGTVLAKGGAQSGNGGRVETSSHHNLQVTGAVDVSARAGQGGNWLLDPTDVTIVGTMDRGSNVAATDNTTVFSPTAGGAQILNTTLSTALNKGGNVTVQTGGTDTAGQAGNITVNAAIAKTAGGDASLTLAADGNITVNQNITTTAGKLDISLLGAGSTTSRTQVLNSSLATLGGNITIDQLRHTTTDADGNSVTNPNAMTVSISNSTLNTTGADSAAAKGDITVRGYNPGVGLSGDVRNGAVMVAVQGNSNLTGNNILLRAEQSGRASTSFPVFLNTATLLADQDITVSGDGTGGANAYLLEIRGNNVLTATRGNITIENQQNAVSDKNGVWLNGTTPGSQVLTAGENIIITGSTSVGTGVQVNNVTFNATGLSVLGVARTRGTGFTLSGITTNVSMDNLTLSSAGSAGVVQNVLDSSLTGGESSKRDALLKKHIENMTRMDMNGVALFSDSTKGWTADYSTTDMPAGGWIFNNTTVAAGGDLALRGVGFVNSTVSTTAGNIAITGDGNTVLSRTNLTAPGDISVSSLSGMTLDGGNVTSSGGDITLTTGEGQASFSGVSISGRDIRVDGTAADAGMAGIQINGGSNMTATGNITLTGVQSKPGGGYGIHFWANSGLTAGDTIVLDATATDGKDGALNMDSGRFSAKNTIFTGTSLQNNRGVSLGNNISVSKGNLTINGVVANQTSAGASSTSVRMSPGLCLTVSDGDVTLTGKNLSGAVSNGITGIDISGATLNVSGALSLTGSVQGGKGFVLNNVTLEGGVKGGANVTLSSAGSGSGTFNQIGSGILDSSSTERLMQAGIENMTQVEMDGVAIFSDSTAGWTKDYTSEARPDGGWIFNNTTVTAGGDVNLKGAGFTNSTLSITGGSLNISNRGPAILTGSTITANDGGVMIHTAAGNLDLTHGNISAKNDISLTADNGTFTLAGTDAKDTANITSTAGSITVRADKSTGIRLSNVNINASKDNSISADIAGSGGTYGLYLVGENTFSGENTRFNIINTGQGDPYYPLLGIGFHPNSDVTFNGNTSLNSRAEGALLFRGQGGGPATHYVHVNNGTLKIHAVSNAEVLHGALPSAAIIVGNFYTPNTVIFDLNNADVNILGDASGSTADVPGFAAASNHGSDYSPFRNAFQFTGKGNVSVTGKSNDGVGVNFRDFSNEKLNGAMSIRGDSVSGTGVYIDGNMDINAGMTNASVTGNSQSGIGILVNVPKDHSVVDFGNNTISGTSQTSSGIKIGGNNITITSGTLSGMSGGSEAGVVLNGGAGYVIDGATVTGVSVDGTGVSVSGNLSVNNDAVLNGTATGSGSGVSVSGNLQSDGGVSITGNATTGNGVLVSGDTTLANATLSGSTESGAGVNITGNLISAGSTTVSGNATGSGAGVELGGSVSGGSVAGDSAAGTGVLVSGSDSTVTG